jgi:lipoprotein signal peptidase
MAHRSGGRPVVLGVVLVVLGCLADQISKAMILADDLVAYGERRVITPFMDFVLAWNQGISYGLFQQEADLGRWLLVTVSLAAIAFLGRWMTKTDSFAAAAGLGLIVGGAIGNTIDRVRFGAVVDFVHLHAFGYSWYVFNLADCWIVAGVGLLLYDSLVAGHEDAAKSE